MSNGVTKGSTLMHNDYVSSVSWHPDSNRLATGSLDGTVIIWDVINEERFAIFSLERGFFDVVWSPDGSCLATIDRRCLRSEHSENNSRIYTAHIWNVERKKQLLSLFHEDDIDEIAWHPEGNIIATGLENGTTYIWDAKTGDKLATLQHNDLVEEVSWSPDGSKIATGSWDNTARVWDSDTGKETFRIDESKIEGGVVWGAVGWNHDGSKLATASKNRNITIWDTTEWKKIQVLQVKHDLSLVKWSPKGNHLIAGTHYTPATSFPHRTDTEVYLSIWNLERDSSNAVWKREGIMREVVWHPDGTMIATGMDDGAIYILDARTGSELGFMNHSEQVLSMDWSPDGTKLATGSKDNTAIIWDTS